MNSRLRSILILTFALAARSAFAARVEIAPEALVPAAPGVTALSIAPAPLSLSPAAFAVSAPILAAPAAFAAPALQVPAAASIVAAAPSLTPAAAALTPAGAPALTPARAAASAVSGRGDSHPTLLSTLSAPAADAEKLDAAGAEKDFAARAQLGAPDVGEGTSFPAASIAPAPVRANSTLQAAKKPVATKPDAIKMETELIPRWMGEELPVAAAKLGRPLPAEYAADVLARSAVWVYKWHSRWTYEISGGLPDGHYDPKFGIRVMLKLDWRKLKDPETHFKVLYAHEYTHWLQEEGLVTRRYGGEIPAVAVEQLRAVELVGLEGMKAGHVGFIAAGNVQSFEEGREWAKGDMKDVSRLYFRGVLGGVAYEVGRIAGRPEAAWEFLNLVIAEKGGLAPHEAFERVTGRKK